MNKTKAYSVQLGSLRSSEIEPAGSIRLSSGAQSQENGGEGAWCTLPHEFRRRMENCCKRLRDNKKLN